LRAVDGPGVTRASQPALRLLPAAALLLLFAITLTAAFPLAPGMDYYADASTAVDALARLDLHGYAANPPLMGPASIALRAPFVALVYHRDIATVYYAGALPCVAAAAGLGLVLRSRMLALGKPALAATLVAVVAVVNPGTYRALNWGHPEEILGGVLCVLAIFGAGRGRPLLAGVALGLALATKQWAAIAIVPALIAAPGRRVLLLAVALAVAAACIGPTMLGAPAQYAAMNKSAAAAHPVVTAPNVWYPLSDRHDPAKAHFAGTLPTWLAHITHPLIVLIGVPLGWLFLRRRRSASPAEALGLFALLMLLRCLLDPWNIDYYHAPFLLALLAWEGLVRGGWPKLTLLAGAALALTFPASLDSQLKISEDAARYCVTYLAWTLPLAAWLGLALLAPARLAAIRDAAFAPFAQILLKRT
jgi:hypothetical protein